MIDKKITRKDEPLIREWRNVREASVDDEGDVWVSDPQTGHWLSDDDKAAYIDWRANR